MLPIAVSRVSYYRRNSHENYVHWLLQRVELRSDTEWASSLLASRTRSEVDDMVLERLMDKQIEDVIEEKPSWVEAAMSVIEGLADDIGEVIEEVIEEIFEEDAEPIEDREEETHEDSIEEAQEEEEEAQAEEEEAPDEEVPDEVEEVIDENPFGGEVDYNSFTVRELQDQCRLRGITIRGTKSEVVLRLRRDDAGIVEQPTKGETEAPSQEAAEDEPDAPSQEAATEEVTQHDDSRQTQPNYEEE